MAKENGRVRSTAEAVSEIKRELGVRQRCYTRWVSDGKLTEVDAIDRMQRLEAALSICERALDLESMPAKVEKVVRVELEPWSNSDRVKIGVD